MHTKRPAFVLNELAVALMVLAALGGLLCHTVQRVCVDSERTRCRQRLSKQERGATDEGRQKKQRVFTRPSPRVPRPSSVPATPVSLTRVNHPFPEDK